MGVDNSAVLFVGLRDTKLDLVFEDEVELEKCLEGLTLEYRGLEGLGYHPLNGYNNEGNLIGYLVADSGSYGSTVIDWLDLQEVERYKRDFYTIFKIEPKLYLFNYQY